MVICGLAEPCGAIAGGAALTAGVGGLLSGVSAELGGGLTNQNGLAATAFTGGLISGVTGSAGFAGTQGVVVGAGAAALGGFVGDLAGQVAAGQSLNMNSRLRRDRVCWQLGRRIVCR